MESLILAHMSNEGSANPLMILHWSQYKYHLNWGNPNTMQWNKSMRNIWFKISVFVLLWPLELSLYSIIIQAFFLLPLSPNWGELSCRQPYYCNKRLWKPWPKDQLLGKSWGIYWGHWRIVSVMVKYMNVLEVLGPSDPIRGEGIGESCCWM